MSSEAPGDFEEATLGSRPIRALGLAITGSTLEPILEEFQNELAAAGIRVRPHFYLSTEWGVPFETIAIAIPFYLIRPELAKLHGDRTGFVEGIDRVDILRYLRHEMGHVVNYAYVLYERTDWIETFGSITQPYVEEYRPEPWSPRYVRHLPGWYAQKHPDEDWSETFAVWATPGFDWRAAYNAWPHAMRKLELCDAIMTELRNIDPKITATELDEDVGEIETTIDDYYRECVTATGELPLGIDGSLRAIFGEPDSRGDGRPASSLINSQQHLLSREVYTWTGHFPESTFALLRHLGSRADALGLTCAKGDESRAAIRLTVFVTSLAMNHVHRGNYAP